MFLKTKNLLQCYNLRLFLLSLFSFFFHPSSTYFFSFFSLLVFFSLLISSALPPPSLIFSPSPFSLFFFFFSFSSFSSSFSLFFSYFSFVDSSSSFYFYKATVRTQSMAPLNYTPKLAPLYIRFLRFSLSKPLLSLSAALTNDVALQN